MWAEPEPKTTVVPMSCTQSIGQKLYCKPMVLMENGTLPKGAFGDTPTKYQEPKIGNPKHTTNFRFQKFIPSILSHVEKKIAHFNSTFVFKIRAKWGDIARKLSALAAPGLSYYLKRTITSLVYSASPRFRWQTHKCVGSGFHQIYWIMFIQYI